MGYLVRSAPNVDAFRESNALLDRLQREFGLQFLRSVDCRASLCKVVLKFRDRTDPPKLLRYNLLRNRQYIYSFEAVDTSEATLTLFITEPKVAFGDLGLQRGS